jgi:alkylhydroperoxidase family enzyme
MMPRVPYQPSDLKEPAELVDAIRKRRGGMLLNLDRMLLQSAPFAKGWNAFLGEVRSGLSLSPKFRELAMCVVAVLNDAGYEFLHHAPELIKAGGTQGQVDLLKNQSSPTLMANLLPSGLFDPVEIAVIALTFEMTVNVKVKDETFDDLKSKLSDDKQVVELVGVIATYNMVSRFLVALGVEPEDHAS